MDAIETALVTIIDTLQTLLRKKFYRDYQQMHDEYATALAAYQVGKDRICVRKFIAWQHRFIHDVPAYEEADLVDLLGKIAVLDALVWE